MQTGKEHKPNDSSATRSISSSQKRSGEMYQLFKDNRPEAISQQKLQRTADKSVHTQRTMQLQSSASGFPVTQLATTIDLKTQDYEYETGYTEKVGHIMNAHIDPKKPKSGTAPGGSEIKDTMDAFYNLNYRGMIRGHLMNGQLGGPGVAANLFPISSKANSEHKFEVENPIKEVVKQGDEVDYSVEAVPYDSLANGDPDAYFHCEATNATTGKKLLEKDIESRPKASSTGTGWADALGVGVWNGIRHNFQNKNLPKGWGESGSGVGKGKTWSHVTADGKKMKDS